MANFVGNWNQIERTNVDAFIALLEVPDDKKAKARENAKSVKTTVKFEGGALNITMTMPAGTREVKLVVGQDTTYTASSGKKMLINTTEITDNSAKAIVKSEDGSKEWGTLNSSVAGDTLTMTMKLFDVESVSTFKKA